MAETFTDVTTVVDDRVIEIHHKDGGIHIFDFNNVRVPHESFLLGKHVVFVRKERSDRSVWRGTAWTKGVDRSGFVMRTGTDLPKMMNEFESQYGLPDSIHCFSSQVEARKMFPDFFL